MNQHTYSAEVDALLIAAGWLRYHDRDHGGPKPPGSPLGRLIIHDWADRKDWERQHARPRPPVGDQVDHCMMAAQLVNYSVAHARCAQAMRDQLWLISATGWLSPDGSRLHFRDNGELCGYLASSAERLVGRLPIKEPERVVALWSFGDLFGEDLRRRVRSRQKQAARLKDTLAQAITRQLIELGQ